MTVKVEAPAVIRYDDHLFPAVMVGGDGNGMLQCKSDYFKGERVFHAGTVFILHGDVNSKEFRKKWRDYHEAADRLLGKTSTSEAQS